MKAEFAVATKRCCRAIYVLVLCSTLITPAQAASENRAVPQDIPEPWAQFLDQYQWLIGPLRENSQDYIHCLEQQPELQSHPDDIATLLENISGMSETCQFLLDELLRQYQQPSEKRPVPDSGNAI